MHTFLTLATLAACGVLAYISYLWAKHAELCFRNCQASELRLKTLRGDVSALGGQFQALEIQVNRIQGRVYRTTQRSPEAQEQIERDNLAAHLKRSDNPGARETGRAHELLGVGIAAPDAAKKSCTCGWCATCTMGPVVTN